MLGDVALYLKDVSQLIPHILIPIILVIIPVISQRKDS